MQHAVHVLLLFWFMLLTPTLTAASSQPQVTTAVVPIYPQQQSGAREEGEVDIQIVIDRGGHVASAHAISGPSRLRLLAEGVAKQWRFSATGSDTTEALLIFKFIARPKGEMPAGITSMFKLPNVLEIYGEVPGKSRISDPGVTDIERPRK